MRGFGVTVLNDVRATFTRQNLVQNGVVAALLLIVSPVFHFYADLEWPYLVPALVGVFLLAAIGVHHLRGEKNPALDAQPERYGPMRKTGEKLNQALVEYEKAQPKREAPSTTERLEEDPSELTPYGRLRLRRDEGRLLRQELQPGMVGFNMDMFLFGSNKIAKWSTQVTNEIKAVAPDFYPEWVHAAAELGLTLEGLSKRLELLGNIMSRLLAKERP
jgi:hypothetical protein